MKKSILVMLLFFSVLSGCSVEEKKDLDHNDDQINQNDRVFADSEYFNYVLLGEVNEIEIYRRFMIEGVSIACTEDMVPLVVLENGYYLPGGNSGSCYSATYAVIDNTVYVLSGHSPTPLYEIGLTVEELCSIEGVCGVLEG